MKTILNLLLIVLANSIVFAQVIDPTETIKNKTNDRVNQKSNDIIDQGLNKIEEGIGSIFKKKDKKTKDTKNNNKPSNASTSSNSGNYTDFAEYEGSTFIPGKNVIFYEDFSIARLGNGTSNWHLYEYDAHTDVERPNVRTLSGASGNWLKMPRKGFVFPNSFKRLPENFTLEYDLYADPNKMNEMESGFKAVFIAREDREEHSIYFDSSPSVDIDVHPHGSTEFIIFSVSKEYVSGESSEERTLFNKTFERGWKPGEINRVAISRNGSHIKVYLNGKQYVDLPNALPKKVNYNLIMSTNLWGDGMYVSNIRLASDVPNASQDIKNEGKFVTNAIYFDVNSSKIKAESWATLNMTAQAIKGTSGTILIVGHTDSDGSDEANLNLSKNRANAVKNALVSEFGIDAPRLQIDGKGESQPVAPNNNASGKAQNRRVEFIKQ